MRNHKLFHPIFSLFYEFIVCFLWREAGRGGAVRSHWGNVGNLAFIQHVVEHPSYT